MKLDNVINTIHYTTLIRGYSKINALSEVLYIFKIMKES